MSRPSGYLGTEPITVIWREPIHQRAALLTFVDVPIGATTLKKTFISFDCSHDGDLREILAEQSAGPDSPFTITDFTAEESPSEDSNKRLRQRIDQVDLVIVVCGKYTNSANGPNDELGMARDVGKEYFLLYGRPGTTCTKPTTASDSDQMYHWTSQNLRCLVGGNRHGGAATPDPHI